MAKVLRGARCGLWRGVLGRGCQVGPVQHLGHQALENLAVAAVDVEDAVAGFKHPRRAGVRAGVAMALRLVAAEQMLHAGITRYQHGVVKQGHFHLLTHSLPICVFFACEQRAQDGVARPHRAADVHHRRQSAHPQAIGTTVPGHEAAFHLRDGVEAQPVGKRALAAIVESSTQRSSRDVRRSQR